MDTQLFQHLLRNSIHFLPKLPSHLCKKKLINYTCIGLILDLFYLIDLYVYFFPLLQCLHYCKFIIGFKIKQYDSPTSFFFQSCFSYYKSFVFPHTFSFYLFLKYYLFILERKRETEREGARGKGPKDRDPQGGPALPAQSPIWGLKTMNHEIMT